MTLLHKVFAVPTPEMATLEEWDQWEVDSRRNFPVRYFLSWTLDSWIHRTWNALVHEPIYWLKCRLWYRYNVVYVKSLPPTWCDRDHLLLHAAFQVFKDFCDREKNAGQHFDLTESRLRELYSDAGDAHAEERIKIWRTMHELYDWWETRRKDDSRDRDSDDEMLRKLISIRKHLWT